MKTKRKLNLAVLILIFICFTGIRSGFAQRNFNLPLDSVITLLTSDVWYDSYSGDIPLVENYFVHIPNTIDSIRWNDIDYKLIRLESMIYEDSAWVLQTRRDFGFSYEILLLNNNGLSLTPYFIMDVPQTNLIHVKPQPASTEAKNKFVEKISGDWYVIDKSPAHEYQNVTRVHFEICATSPDSVTYTGYENEVLIWSENYKIVLVYQKEWYLISKNLHAYFYYDKDCVKFIVMGGPTEFQGETCLDLTRNNLADVAEYNLKTNNMKLFPNPCVNFFTISSDIIFNKIEVVGLNGQLLITKNLNEDDENTINISTLSNGVYIVKGYSNNAVYSKKFIKQ